MGKDYQNEQIEKPMISIIVPVYNVEKWLKECLDSIVSQDANDYEAILVDDGSTDGSLKILREYENENPFFHLYEKKNGGLSSARNFGIDKANGDYIYFLDSDDKFYDNKCVSFMQNELKEKDIDVLYFDGNSFFENIELQRQNPYYVNAYKRKKSYGVREKGVYLFNEMVESEEYFPSACLACYRKEYLEKKRIRFEEGYLYEDNLFTFSVMLLAGKVIHNNRRVLSRRVREGSITQTKPTSKNVASYLRAWIQMRQFWQHHQSINDSIQVQTVLDNIKNCVIGTWQNLIPDERENVKGLTNYERYELTNILPKNFDTCGSDYFFPYALLGTNISIVIYGAGKVGTTFYRQAVTDGLVHVVALVDTNAKDIGCNDYPVQPPNVMKNLLFDKVLIAVEREDVSHEVRKYLRDMEIPDEKIEWFGEYYRADVLYGMVINPLMRIMRQIADGKERRFWLFLLPEHGNMGDYAIGYAAQDFLKKYFQDIPRVDVTESDWNRLARQIKKMVKDEDILFLNGGGDFGNLWATGKVQHSIVDMFPNNKIIFLPNTLTYQDKISEKNNSLMEDMKYFSAKNNVHIFFRERNSYEFCVQHLKNVYCYPDMVLSRTVPRTQLGERKKALLCFRGDKESVFSGKEKLKNILSEHQWNYEEMDIHQMRHISQSDGKECLERIIEKLQSAEVVITDRLHGMVLSVTGQVPCIAFDNSTKKVSGLYDWFKDNPNVKIGYEEKLEDLMDWIKDVTEKPCDFKPFDNEFDDMANKIKEIIG